MPKSRYKAFPYITKSQNKKKKYQVEVLIAKSNKTLETHNKKWKELLPVVQNQIKKKKSKPSLSFAVISNYCCH